ncbi:MAG: endonuclease/exonuclease/phosphatase family protein [Deltaproteobacteria bacterium]|nr:endonuclease/exonuclease/phosphatase family protein [Deltaproteobacteria bacterium]
MPMKPEPEPISEPTEPQARAPSSTNASAPALTRRARLLPVLDRWLVVFAVGSALVAPIRLVPFQVPFPFSAFEAEARWVIPFAIAGLALSIARRSTRTAIAYGACLAILVPWSLEWLPATLGRDDSRHADLRVLSTNLLAPSPTPALAREILAIDADVVLVQEASDEWWAVLETEGVLARYPHHVEETHSFREDYMGIAILSRLPITRSAVERLGGTFVPYAWADITTEDGQHVRLYSIHTWPPFAPSLLEMHVDQMAHLRHLAARDREDDALDAIVIGGDFNASPMSRQYRLLRDIGVTSAHERMGRGFATTWPNLPVLPVPVPPMRLDHVFVAGEHVEVVSVREGIGEGSDHLPVLVELSLAP